MITNTITNQSNDKSMNSTTALFEARAICFSSRPTLDMEY